MDIELAIQARRSVRNFTPRPIARQVLARLIDAAIQAPSALNEQPWLFTVVQDRDLLAQVSTSAKAHALRESAVEFPRSLRERLAQPDFDLFYRAPALIVIASQSPGRWAVENCALAAENLMLRACADGLGTCWIGLAQSWLATPDGKRALRLSPDCVPVAPIIVGEPATPPPPVPRNAPRIAWIGS
ncbi:MAG: nitroreductase [Gammaproteobacteria bacterium]|nr:nitroreductase [Gammaproteobacteria bacterium]